MDNNKTDIFDLEIQALKEKAVHIEDMFESSGEQSAVFFDQSDRVKRRKSHKPKICQEGMISGRDIDELFDQSVKISRGELLQGEVLEKNRLFEADEITKEESLAFFGEDDEDQIEEFEVSEQSEIPKKAKIQEEKNKTTDFKEIVREEKTKKQRPVIQLEPVKVNWAKWSPSGGFVDLDAEEKAAKEAARIAEEEAIRKAEEERMAAEKEAEEKALAEKAAQDRETLKAAESPVMEILRSYRKEKEESVEQLNSIQPDHSLEEENDDIEEPDVSFESSESETEKDYHESEPVSEQTEIGEESESVSIDHFVEEEEINFEGEDIVPKNNTEEIIEDVPEEEIDSNEKEEISDGPVEELHLEDVKIPHDDEVKKENIRKPIFSGMSFNKGNQKKEEILPQVEIQAEDFSDNTDQEEDLLIEEVLVEENTNEEIENQAVLSFLNEQSDLSDNLNSIDLSPVETPEDFSEEISPNQSDVEIESLLNELPELQELPIEETLSLPNENEADFSEISFEEENLISDPFEAPVVEEKEEIRTSSEPVFDFFGEPSEDMSIRLAAMDEFFELSKREEEIPSVLDDLAARKSKSDCPTFEITEEKGTEKEEDRKEEVYVSDNILDLDILCKEDNDESRDLNQDAENNTTNVFEEEIIFEEDLPEIELKIEGFENDKIIEPDDLDEGIFFEEEELIETIPEEESSISKKDDFHTFENIPFDPNTPIFVDITEVELEEKTIQEEDQTSFSDIFEEEELPDHMFDSENFFTEEIISEDIIISEPIFEEEIIPENLIGNDPIFEEEIL